MERPPSFQIFGVMRDAAAPFGAYTVELKITCADGTTATTTRFVCFSFGVLGCIFADQGYN